MEKTTVVSVNYKESDSITIQGKRSKIDKYLNDGYYVKENRNGFWVLVKTAQVNVTLSNSEHTETFNMKQDVCDYYGKTRITQALVDKFYKDIKAEKISITMDSDCCYSIN